MGLGLEEGKHDARCLGLFISCMYVCMYVDRGQR